MIEIQIDFKHIYKKNRTNFFFKTLYLNLRCMMHLELIIY